MTDLDGTDDSFDSREVIARIEELEAEDGLTIDERQEYEELTSFRDEWASYFSDWEHGVTFIRDDYFEDYAQEYAKDIGAIRDDAPWPCDHIDWEAAAEALMEEFTEVEFRGVTYYGRD